MDISIFFLQAIQEAHIFYQSIPKEKIIKVISFMKIISQFFIKIRLSILLKVSSNNTHSS